MTKVVIAIAGLVVASVGIFAVMHKSPPKDNDRAEQPFSENKALTNKNDAPAVSVPSTVEGSGAESPEAPPAISNALAAEDVTSMKDGAEFDRMFNNQHPSMSFEIAKSVHSAFTREVRDEEWATAKERLISNQYGTSTQHGSPTVECKRTMCEVRLLSPTGGSSAGIDWGSVLLLPLKQVITGDHLAGNDKFAQYTINKDDGDRKTAVVLNMTFQRSTGR